MDRKRKLEVPDMSAPKRAAQGDMGAGGGSINPFTGKAYSQRYYDILSKRTGERAAPGRGGRAAQLLGATSPRRSRACARLRAAGGPGRCAPRGSGAAPGAAPLRGPELPPPPPAVARGIRATSERA
jgi:hypothetical protein